MNDLLAHWRIVLTLGLAAFVGCGRAQDKHDAPLVEVEVTLPKLLDVVDYEEFTGRTESPDMVQVRARVTGHLDKFKFAEGDMVQEGQTLFEIDPLLYEAQLELDSADLVNKKAVLSQKESVFRRTSNLYARGAAPKEDFDNQQGDFEVAKAAVGQAEARVKISKLNLDWTKVASKVSGRVGKAMVTRGNLIVADNTIMTTVVSVDPMYVYFYVDERTLLRLRTEIQSANGSERDVAVEMGLAYEEGYSLTGKLNFEDNRVDNSTGTITMRGTFRNPKTPNGERLLSPGLFARVRITMGAKRKAILIPDRAIGNDQGKKFAYVIKNASDDKTGKPVKLAERRYVQLGVLLNGMREIKEDIKGIELPANQRIGIDEKVVVSGLQRIRPGVGVNATEFEPPLVAAGPALNKEKNLAE